MIIVSISVNVMPVKILEFEQTMESLIAKLQNSKDCLGSDIYRRINRRVSPSYCLVSEWRSTNAVEKHFKSKNFNILSGAIRN